MGAFRAGAGRPRHHRLRQRQEFFAPPLRILVGEAEFDAALKRIKAAGIKFFAEFDRSGPGEINRN